MWSRSKKIDHEYALLGQGVDHQMGLIEEKRGVTGAVGRERLAGRPAS